MARQLDLHGLTAGSKVEDKPKDFKIRSEEETRNLEHREEYDIDYIKDYLSDFHGMYLFDLRWWNGYAEREEIIERLENGWGTTNCGHGDLLIETLLDGHKWSVEDVADFLMSIRERQLERMKKSWLNRLTPSYRERRGEEDLKEVYGYYCKCAKALGEEPRELTEILKRNFKNDFSDQLSRAETSLSDTITELEKAVEYTSGLYEDEGERLTRTIKRLREALKKIREEKEEW
nr:hypothetical protein [uncultured archaeon]